MHAVLYAEGPWKAVPSIFILQSSLHPLVVITTKLCIGMNFTVQELFEPSV